MSADKQAHFHEIQATLIDEVADVTSGKMMSSEAVMYKKKVFAFFGKQGEMVFKLGREFQPEENGIEDYSVLSPFKNKAPMRDWLIIPDTAQWETLARQALTRMQAELNK